MWYCLNMLSLRQRQRRRYYHMMKRCFNTNHPQYADYGGRGITVCNAWVQSFEQFVADIGEPPSDTHSLDRIDNDGNYEPSNVRWATRIEQQRNRRPINGLPVGVRRYRNKFMAEINRDGVYRYLGVHETVELASAAYEQQTKTPIIIGGSRG